jgi:hypothetical protein
MSAETVEKLQMMHFGSLTSLKISHLQVWENYKMVDFRVFRQTRYLSIMEATTQNKSISV